METTASSTSSVQTVMQSCIDACSTCHHTCLQTAMTYCLERGGQHVEPSHFRLMMSCAEVCQTAANLQLSDSPFSAQYCDICAAVCEACAHSCRGLDGMEACVSACVACADSCRSMAAPRH